MRDIPWRIVNGVCKLLCFVLCLLSIVILVSNTFCVMIINGLGFVRRVRKLFHHSRNTKTKKKHLRRDKKIDIKKRRKLREKIEGKKEFEEMDRDMGNVGARLAACKKKLVLGVIP